MPPRLIRTALRYITQRYILRTKTTFSSYYMRHNLQLISFNSLPAWLVSLLHWKRPWRRRKKEVTRARDVHFEMKKVQQYCIYWILVYIKLDAWTLIMMYLKRRKKEWCTVCTLTLSLHMMPVKVKVMHGTGTRLPRHVLACTSSVVFVECTEAKQWRIKYFPRSQKFLGQLFFQNILQYVWRVACMSNELNVASSARCAFTTTGKMLPKNYSK